MATLSQCPHLVTLYHLFILVLWPNAAKWRPGYICLYTHLVLGLPQTACPCLCAHLSCPISAKLLIWVHLFTILLHPVPPDSCLSRDVCIFAVPQSHHVVTCLHIYLVPALPYGSLGGHVCSNPAMKQHRNACLQAYLLLVPHGHDLLHTCHVPALTSDTMGTLFTCLDVQVPPGGNFCVHLFTFLLCSSTAM